MQITTLWAKVVTSLVYFVGEADGQTTIFEWDQSSDPQPLVVVSPTIGSEDHYSILGFTTADVVATPEIVS